MKLDEYYLGIGAGKNLRPLVKEDLITFFEEDHYLAIFDGSIGYGKSFFVSCAFCYELYILGCYKNPQDYLVG